MGLDHAQVQHDIRQRQPRAQNETPGSLTEPVFAGLLKDWHLLGCIRIAAPEGTPVYAGTSSGAAVRERCPNGTGWPAGRSR